MIDDNDPYENEVTFIITGMTCMMGCGSKVPSPSFPLLVFTSKRLAKQFLCVPASQVQKALEALPGVYALLFLCSVVTYARLFLLFVWWSSSCTGVTEVTVTLDPPEATILYMMPSEFGMESTHVPPVLVSMVPDFFGCKRVFVVVIQW